MIDYQKIIRDYPWVLESQNIILSPDSDWMLCWLLLTKFTDSKVVGRYDWKIMLLQNWYDYNQCVFIDMDINRSHIKSVWHHCVMYNKRLTAINFQYRESCIQPNVFRNFDWRSNFQQKYPFWTIHLLVCILYKAWLIKWVKEEGIRPMLFTDWVRNNLFWYTENCLEWIDSMWISDKNNPLYYHFCGNEHSFYEIMHWLNSFLRIRDWWNAEWFYDWNAYVSWWRNKRTWDKLKFSKSNWDPINLIANWGLYHIHDIEKNRIVNFIKSISNYVWWEYSNDKRTWWNFNMKVFSKWDFSNKNLSNWTYLELMHQNPFSMAMTSWNNIEYTLE